MLLLDVILFAFLRFLWRCQVFLSQLILLVQKIMLAERPLNASCRQLFRLMLRASLTRIKLRWRHLTATNDLKWGTFELWLRHWLQTCGGWSLRLRFVRLLFGHDRLGWRWLGSLLRCEMKEIGVFLFHFSSLFIHIFNSWCWQILILPKILFVCFFFYFLF